MRRLVFLVAAALCSAVVASAAFAYPERVEEVWRSPYGVFRGVSVNLADGSCWVSSGSRVLHLGADGQVLARVSGLVQPMGVAVNESDGSCWVAEEGHGQVLHLAADGTVLATVPGLRAGLMAVNPTNGSCAAAIATPGPGFTYEFAGLVCLAEDGTELWRSDVGEVDAMAASPADGSWWLGRSSEVIRVRADGAEAWRHDFGGGWQSRLPASLSVNAMDGTAWVTDCGDIVHLSAGGSELSRITGTLAVSVSVDSDDGALWVGATDGQVLHLSTDGTELLRVTNLPGGYQNVPTASPADGSCWVMVNGGVRDQWLLPLSLFDAILHLAADGGRIWGAGTAAPTSVASSPRDGSCWLGHGWTMQSSRGLARLAPDGMEVQRIDDLDVHAVAVNPADGSAWVLTGGLLHLAADGSELLNVSPFPYGNALAVNSADGSCWIAAGQMTIYAAGRTGDYWPGEVIHVAEDGTTLLRVSSFQEPHSVSVDPGDGSCWLADGGQAIHLAEDGTELSRTESGSDSGYRWVSVDPVDGSCWAAGTDLVAHLAPDGSELWRRDGLHAGPLSVNAEDGSCWMTSAQTVPSRVVHFAADGVELWASTDLAWDPYGFPGLGAAVSVNPMDGSCWIADAPNEEVVRFAPPEYPVSHFDDVPVRHWAFDEVEACFAAGIVQGYWDDTYRPGLPVTRDQMAVYISRALAGGDEGVQVPSGLAEPSFTDVGDDHWAYRYIEYCAGANIVEGYPDGGYHPDAVVNRGQMAVYIARALLTPSGDAGLPDLPDEPTFPNVTAENDWAWCYPHVEYCAAEGVVQGYWDGTYRPAQAVTRDQMAVYIARAFALPL